MAMLSSLPAYKWLIIKNMVAVPRYMMVRNAKNGAIVYKFL